MPRSRTTKDQAGAAARTNAQSHDRRIRLLEAGQEIFTERRYEDVSAQEIAGYAGVAHGLLFHYFGTKRGFFLAVLEHATAGASELFTANTEPDPAQWLRNETDLILTGISGSGRLFASLIHGSLGAESEAREMVTRVRAATTERVLTKLAPEQCSDLLVRSVRAWTTCTNELGAQWLQDGRRVPKREVQSILVSMLNAALRAVAARDPIAKFDPERFAGAGVAPPGLRVDAH